MTTEIRVRWPEIENENGRPMLWFGSWLVSGDGSEGGWFHSGRGGAQGSYAVPPVAIGMRIRCWPNDGLEAEYADILSLESVQDLVATDLDFDRRQPFSRLPEDFG